ncbi:MAG: hypothetical protein NVS2B8_15700 [Vulcanimicrobiaceae bacterium]
MPSVLRIVSVLPGKTLSGIYFASYKSPSTLVYHEVAIVVAAVSYRGRRFWWAPQLYVDDPTSVVAGGDLWGLHKTLASFERTRTQKRGTATVRVDGLEIVSVEATAGGPVVALRAPIPALGVRDDVVRTFVAKAVARVRIARATVSFPEDSPLRPAFARGAFAAVRFDDLALDVPAPHHDALT